jgi:hypothetical protein
MLENLDYEAVSSLSQVKNGSTTFGLRDTGYQTVSISLVAGLIHQFGDWQLNQSQTIKICQKFITRPFLSFTSCNRV